MHQWIHQQGEGRVFSLYHQTPLTCLEPGHPVHDAHLQPADRQPGRPGRHDGRVLHLPGVGGVLHLPGVGQLPLRCAVAEFHPNSQNQWYLEFVTREDRGSAPWYYYYLQTLVLKHTNACNITSNHILHTNRTLLFSNYTNKNSLPMVS